MTIIVRDKTEIGAEVARLRKERDLSQEAVGAALDIDKTAIAKIEKGKRALSGSEALLLSRLFGVEVQDLLAKPSTSSVLVRASMPSDPAVDNMLDTMRSIVDDFFWSRAITRYATGPTTQVPFRAKPECSPVDAAAEARQRLGLGDGPLQDLLETVQNGLDIPVISIWAEQSRVDGMLAVERAVPFVVVNSAASPTRQRFTLAHELGHWMLGHGEAVDTASTLSEKSRDNERDACRFSAAFLLPRTAVDRWYYDRIDGGRVELHDVVALASQYGVDEKVALIQLEEADRITKSRGAQLRKSLTDGEHRQYRMFRLKDGVEIAHRDGVDVLAPLEMFGRLCGAVLDDRIPIEVAAERLRYPLESLRKLVETHASIEVDEPAADEIPDYHQLVVA